MFIGKKCTSFAIKRKTENYKYRLIWKIAIFGHDIIF